MFPPSAWEIKVIQYNNVFHMQEEKSIWLEDESPNEDVTKWICLWKKNQWYFELHTSTKLALNFNRFFYKGLERNQMLYSWI